MFTHTVLNDRQTLFVLV